MYLWKLHEFLRRLKSYDSDRFEYCNGLDLLDSLRMTIFDDRSVFDNVSTAFIREDFAEWAATAPQQEQDTYLNLQLTRYYNTFLLDSVPSLPLESNLSGNAYRTRKSQKNADYRHK